MTSAHWRWLGAGALVVVLSLPLVAERAAANLIVKDPLDKADAIYVLGGDVDNRPPYAAELYRNGLAPVILLPREVVPTIQVFPPTVDQALGKLMAAGIWRPNTKPGEGFAIRMPLTEGRYEVFLWHCENHKSHFRSMNVSVEGVALGKGIGDMAVGEWRRSGPYSAEVRDGMLDLEVVNAGKGDPFVSGFALYKRTSPASVAQFVRGVQFGRAPLTLEGQTWMSFPQALSEGLELAKGSLWRVDRTFADETVDRLRSTGIPGEAIVQVPFPGGVTSTMDEALALRDYVREHHLKRIIVVTSASHSRRARWVLTRIAHSTGAQILMAPVVPSSRSRRVMNEEAVAGLVTEYVKLFYYAIRYPNLTIVAAD